MKNQCLIVQAQVDSLLLQTKATGWQEHLHPRASDGRFGSKSDSESQSQGKTEEDEAPKLSNKAEKTVTQAAKHVVNFVDKVSGSQKKRQENTLKLTLASIAIGGVVAIGSALILKRSGKAVKAAEKSLKEIEAALSKDKNTADLLHDKIIDLRSYASGAKTGIEKEIKRSVLSEDIVSGALFNKETEEAMAKKHGPEAIRFLNNWDKADEALKEKMKDYAAVQAALKPQFEALHQSLENGEAALAEAVEQYRSANLKRTFGNINQPFAKTNVELEKGNHKNNIVTAVGMNIGSAIMMGGMMNALREEYSGGLLR